MNEPYRESGKAYPEWEYFQIKLEFSELDKAMPTFGKDGWELVNVCRIPNDPTEYRLFFKRMK